ncbi:hypothetical protein ACFE04_001210 [Oxalis oulophora]
MAKKKYHWINVIKRFLSFDSISKPDKKEKRWRWVFGRLKVKRLASIAGLETEEEQQGRQSITVTLSTPVTVSNEEIADQETGTRQVMDQEAELVLVQLDSPKAVLRFDREVEELSAIRIQTAFRSLLCLRVSLRARNPVLSNVVLWSCHEAKKALRALKGIVRLQAIIRGRLVRRQAMTTLKCLQSIVNIQTQVCAKRNQLTEEAWDFGDNKQLQTLRDKIIKMDVESQRRWDDSVMTKETADALYLSKKEAMLKRERIREYWFSHRNSAETERQKVNGRWRYWLEQWVDTQLSKSKELEDLDTVLTTTNQNPRQEYRIKKPKHKSFQRRYEIEGLDSPIKKSTNPRNNQDDGSHSGSPVVPAYMAATESAKAKLRSLSSPRIRSGSFDSYSESCSPYKNKLPLLTSVASQGFYQQRSSAYQQRSPSLKSVPGPIKSSRTLKDLSIDSDCSFSTWDRQSAFK